MRMAICMLLAMGCVWARAAGAVERTFKGKTAAQWVMLVDDLDTGTRLEAITALVAIDKGTEMKPPIEKIEPLLLDADVTIRVRAAKWLASRMKDELIAMAMIPVLESTSVPMAVQMEAVNVVSLLGPAGKAAGPSLEKLRQTLMKLRSEAGKADLYEPQLTAIAEAIRAIRAEKQ